MISAYAFFMVILILFDSPEVCQAVNGKIYKQDLDTKGNGYTIMRVWGSYYEMGYAHGCLLGDQIDKLVNSIKDIAGNNYTLLKSEILKTHFPSDVVEEIEGMVQGVKETVPDSTISAGDVLMLNTGSDWFYTAGCRSHSCWGSYVAAPVKTLTTRRLDFQSVEDFYPFINILVCAYDPIENDAIRWVNVILPGQVIAATSVNEYGTVVSIHDSPASGESASAGANTITRSIALRYMMTIDALPDDVSKQVDFIFSKLGNYMPWTGSFFNYYAPMGYGGVVSASPDRGFYQLRKPNQNYFNGEVLVTSNVYTDGESTPEDALYFETYYSQAKPKTISDHWEVLDTVSLWAGAFQMSVAYRGREDMTIWVRGRLAGTNTTPILKMDWNQLFPAHVIYGANAYGLTDMLEIEPEEQIVQKMGDTLFETQAMDQDPETGKIYYMESESANYRLASWDPESNVHNIVCSYAPGTGIYAKQMAFSPVGRLYSLDNEDRLYKIDKRTGDLSLIGKVTGLAVGDYGRTGDMIILPDDTVYIFTYGDIYSLDVKTMAASLVSGNLLNDGAVWTGAAICSNGMVYATDAEIQSHTSSVYSIDLQAGTVSFLFDAGMLINDLASNIYVGDAVAVDTPDSEETSKTGGGGCFISVLPDCD